MSGRNSSVSLASFTEKIRRFVRDLRFCMWHKISVNVQEEYQDYSDILRDGDLVEGNSLN